MGSLLDVERAVALKRQRRGLGDDRSLGFVGGVLPDAVRDPSDLVGGTYTLTLASLLPSEISFGETVSGVVEAGERAFWAFEGTADQIVTIAMQELNSGLDTYLELLGPYGKILAEDDDGGGDRNSEIGNFVLPKTDTYVIVARGYSDSSGAYELTLTEGAE